MKRISATLVFLAVACSSPAWAAPIGFDFSATVTGPISSSLAPYGIFNGTPVTGRILWETSLTDGDPDPMHDVYSQEPFVFSVSFEASGIGVRGDGAGLNVMDVRRSSDSVIWSFTHLSPVPNPAGIDGVYFSLTSRSPSQVALGSEFLQSFVPSLWGEGRLVVDALGHSGFTAEVVGVTVVPEPCSLLLMALGLAVWCRRR